LPALSEPRSSPGRQQIIPIWTVLATGLRSAKGVQDGGPAERAFATPSLAQRASGDLEKLI
jgi:hypothetical protein